MEKHNSLVTTPTGDKESNETDEQHTNSDLVYKKEFDMLLAECKMCWEKQMVERVQMKQEVHADFDAHVKTLERLIRIWQIRIKQAIDDHFQSQEFAPHLDLLNKLKQIETTMKSTRADKTALSTAQFDLEGVRLALTRSEEANKLQKPFVLNTLDPTTSFEHLDRLSGVTVVASKGELEINDIQDNLQVVGTFAIQADSCQISDARLVDGILYVSDLRNSAIYSINAWTGTMIQSTSQFSFQHSILFPQSLTVSKAGYLVVEETTCTKQLFSEFNSNASSKKAIRSSVDLIDPRDIRHLVQERGNLNTLKSKLELLWKESDYEQKAINLTDTRRLLFQNFKAKWIQQTDNYVLATGYHTNMVIYIDDKQDYWYKGLNENCGPKSAMVGGSEMIYICCTDANHIHKLTRRGTVTGTVSLEYTKISRPISISYRDSNHLLIVDKIGRIYTLKF